MFTDSGFPCFALPYRPERVSGHHSLPSCLKNEVLRPMATFFDLLYTLDEQLYKKVKNIFDKTEFFDSEWCYGYTMRFDVVGNRRYLSGVRNTRYSTKELSMMWMEDVIAQISYHKFGKSNQKLFTSLEKRDVKQLWEAAGFVDGERPSFMMKWE